MLMQKQAISVCGQMCCITQAWYTVYAGIEAIKTHQGGSFPGMVDEEKEEEAERAAFLEPDEEEEESTADSLWMLALYDFLNDEANTQGGHGI